MVSLYGWRPSESRDGAELVPRMALGEPETDDGYVWLIRVNPGAKWSNGEPITAHTFIYSWKMGLDPVLVYPNHGSIIAGGRVEIVNAENYFAQNLPGRDAVDWDAVGMRALDDHTLEITTARVYTAFDVMLHFAHRATAPVYEPLYEAGMNAARTSTLYGTSLEHFMGNGPFVLTSWTKGSERVFERNENYLFSHEIKLDGIYGRVAAEEITRIELFQSGQSDFIELGVSGLMRYEEDPRLVSFNRQRIWSIESNRDNPEKPILADPLFRRALFYATDREAIASLINATPATYFLSTVGVSFNDGTAFRDIYEANDWLPPNHGFNPEYARELLSQVFELYGLDSISLTLAYGEDQGLRAASELIQSQWEQVFGRDIFTLSLRAMQHSAVLQLMSSSVPAPNADWDLGWSGVFPRAEAFSPHVKFRQYLSDAPGRYTNYGNSTLDEMYDLFNDEKYRLDEHKRFELTREIEKHFILEDVTVIPVFQEKAFVIFNSRVQLPLHSQSPIIGFAWEYSDINE
jgi:ABC-type oligopeptide transport system substrate-binding subunit